MRRFFLNFAVAWAVLWNRYEAGQRYGTGQSYLPAEVGDARYDADPPSRLEMLRKARYWERNCAVVQRLADVFQQFTVGAKGLTLIPSSNSPTFNLAATDWLREWSKVCDLSSRQHFSTLQSLVALRWFIDGEVFILKTFGKEIRSAGGEPIRRPRIQLIEAHRVETPSCKEGKNIIDGIEIDDNGRPTAYWVKDAQERYSTEVNYRRIPAENIIHVFEPSRVCEYRGVTMLHAVLKDEHDLSDLQELEKQCAKIQAELSYMIETPTGELPSLAMSRQARLSMTTQKSDGTDVEKTRWQQIVKVLGARVGALRVGDKLHRFAGDRISDATVKLWDHLTSKICAGVGISKMFVFPWSIQGTVLRFDSDISTAFFRSRSEVLQTVFSELYEWLMDWAKANDRRLADVPGDWRNVTVRPPRAPNVDVGRNSAAMIAELDAGIRTLEGIFAELGLDWREQIRQRFVEEKFINDLAASPEFEGVTPDRIRKSIGDALKRLAEEQAVIDQEDEEGAGKEEEEAIAA